MNLFVLHALTHLLSHSQVLQGCNHFFVALTELINIVWTDIFDYSCIPSIYEFLLACQLHRSYGKFVLVHKYIYKEIILNSLFHLKKKNLP